MKNSNPVLFVLGAVLLVLLSSPAFAATPASAPPVAPATEPAVAKPGQVIVTIFCTGDIHEHTDGMARIAGYIKAAKQKDPNVLYLDAGDAIGGFGAKELAVTRGEGMVRLFLAAGCDACIFGNHCHGTGKDRLGELYLKYPAFPILAANIKWTDKDKELSERIPPYKIFPLKGVRVAVVGACSDDIRYAKGNRFAVYSQVQAITRLVPELRKKADVVVALTHEYEDADYAIANSASPPDLIVGGHSHGATAEPFGRQRQSFLLKSGKYTRYLAVARLTWDGTKIVDRSGQVMPVSDTWPEDPQVKSVREEYFKPAVPEKPAAEKPGTPEEKPAAPAAKKAA